MKNTFKSLLKNEEFVKYAVATLIVLIGLSLIISSFFIWIWNLLVSLFFFVFGMFLLIMGIRPIVSFWNYWQDIDW